MATKVREQTVAERVRDRLEEVATSMINRSKSELERFTMRFADNPAYALEWAAPVFPAAARKELGEFLKADLEREGSDAMQIFVALKRELVSKARFPERSTSVPSNEIALYRAAALAEAIEWVER